MWDVDSTIIDQMVVSANSLIAKSLDQDLKRVSLDGWVEGQIGEETAMWNLDLTIIVSIVVSANGLIAKSLNLHLKSLSLDGWVKGQIGEETAMWDVDSTITVPSATANRLIAKSKPTPQETLARWLDQGPEEASVLARVFWYILETAANLWAEISVL